MSAVEKSAALIFFSVLLKQNYINIQQAWSAGILKNTNAFNI